MNLLLLVFSALFVACIQAEKIVFDGVTPFPETKPTTTEYAVALKYKPQLVIRQGCYPFPAVDAEGNTNEGLNPIRFFWVPRCASPDYADQTSQVYGRATKYEGVWAIMYAWYFPRDFEHRHRWENAIIWLDSLSQNATISAVSVLGTLGKYSTDSPPKPTTIKGSSLKLTYKALFVICILRHLATTSSPGRFQDLIMWDDMTEAARSALETTDFNTDVPMIDDNFLPNIEEAYPF